MLVQMYAYGSQKSTSVIFTAYFVSYFLRQDLSLNLESMIHQDWLISKLQGSCLCHPSSEILGAVVHAWYFYKFAEDSNW